MSEPTQASIDAFLMIENRLFQHQMLNSLVGAGALTQQQAAELCVEMVNNLPGATAQNAAAASLLPGFTEKWEYIAAAVLGMDPLPRG
jgi:hypothetical protein